MRGETYMQLSATANALDRANRPRMLLVVPALLLIGALIFLFVSHSRFSGERDRLSVQNAQRSAMEGIITQTMELRADTPNLAREYPIRVFMDSDIHDLIGEVLGPEGTQKITLGRKSERQVLTSPELNMVDLEANVRNIDLFDLFRWIARVESDERLSGIFVSNLRLSPAQGGWTGSVRFRLYQKKGS